MSITNFIKTNRKILCSILIVLGGLFWICHHILSDDFGYFLAKKEENGDYSVQVKFKEAVLFGSNKIIIKAEDNETNHHIKINTVLYNDGAGIREENVGIAWKENQVKVTLSGQEQKDEYIVLQFNLDEITITENELKEPE